MRFRKYGNVYIFIFSVQGALAVLKDLYGKPVFFNEIEIVAVEGFGEKIISIFTGVSMLVC